MEFVAVFSAIGAMTLSALVTRKLVRDGARRSVLQMVIFAAVLGCIFAGLLVSSWLWSLPLMQADGQAGIVIYASIIFVFGISLLSAIGALVGIASGEVR